VSLDFLSSQQDTQSHAHRHQVRQKATVVFFNVPTKPPLSKRLLFFLTAKITRCARLEKNVVYVAKTAGEISDFVCPLCFHHHPRPPTDRSRRTRPSAYLQSRDAVGQPLTIAVQCKSDGVLFRAGTHPTGEIWVSSPFVAYLLSFSRSLAAICLALRMRNFWRAWRS
jgi:hypothetical protein